MILSLLLPDDWSNIIMPQTPLLEIFIRGSVVYLALFFGLRVILKRESAALGISDVLVVVLLADAVQNGMAGDYQSITDGLLLAMTIIGWDWVLSWLAYRFPGLRTMIRPRPIMLIRDGRLIEKNVNKEFLTRDEIYSHLRQQGIERVEDVKIAYMEGDGAITAIPKGERSGEPKGRDSLDRVL